jgi:hypothetical protein
MKMSMLTAVLLVSVLLVATDASAFIDPPVFASQPIRANEPGTISYRHGACDFFLSVPFLTEIVQLPPNRIQLFVTGLYFTKPMFRSASVANPSCNLPPLQAGDY